MPDFNLQAKPHRRYNPLTGEWILVSPHRNRRPWQGAREAASGKDEPVYDPTCYLCPGNVRAEGVRNPSYSGVFVFDNDFPALLPDASAAHLDRGGLFRAETETGICRVVCFSPRHDLALARMEPTAIRGVVDAWTQQYRELSRRPEVRYVQIFENRGSMMGCSNPHPHGQIWAGSFMPNEPAKEQSSLEQYRLDRGGCLLCDYLRAELASKERLVFENELFAAVVPFWAVWPFETLFIGKRHLSGIDHLNAQERDALADLLRSLTAGYDRLFDTAFPYSMGLHQRPAGNGPSPEWHWHGHFYPPLLRSATVRKFMVGYELLASPQRDITAEAAADRLRQTVQVAQTVPVSPAFS